jgi:signal transduction histidine kinase
VNAALHSLSGQLLRLQDEERKRIARDLHDGTLQLITAMSMNLLLISRSTQIASDPETARLIADAQNLAKQSSRELRSLSYLLHPPELDELGLVAALRSWADGFAQRSGLALEVTLEDPGRLAADAETALFRIAQESLANVQKHSGSSTAELRMTVSDREVRLEVRDDGCGLPPEILTRNPQGVGVGILGMRERARQLGGTLSIETTTAGTTVRAFLPRRSAR